MAEAIVADLASGLVSKLVSLAAEELIQAWNLHQDLVTLVERLETIDALLSDAASQKLTMSVVQNWFNKLEAVAYLAESFMDELAFEVTRRKVENHHKVRNFLNPSRNSLLYRFKVAHKIKSINASFDKIFKWAGDLGLKPVEHVSSTVQLREIHKTPPFEDESQIVGRDSDISYLEDMVCKNQEKDLPVIGVLGMGGQGKTTLARMVYNRDAVIKMFPKRMWITVSNDFDFMKILNEMVESLTSTKSELKNAQGVINKIEGSLKGEKFLLILDDVWNDIQEEWDNLINSLLKVGGAKGSSILVTTRNQEVIDVMRCTVSFPVQKLSEEDSWKLFQQRVFSHGEVIETGPFATLGRRMVQRCGGLPLAIKALGGLLHSKKSEHEWLLIQNSDIWKSKGVLSSLRLSYDNLPYSSLKRCFTYCSIMPKDYDINKDELVQIWMALGFLLPPRGSNALMEDIGNEYFNILLWNSLLQEVKRDAAGNITSCKMHDLVHDLALDLSKHHSVTLKTGHELNHISQAMYVSLDEGVSDIKSKTVKRKFERVQLLCAGARILSQVLPYLQHLTVLILNSDIHYCNELPSSLRKMKYLKYLDISYSYSELPTYITELYNLQTLRVRFVEELPKNFCNLINLRHLLIMNVDDKTRCLLTGIERLTCLQTLPHFVVSKDQNCVLGQLGGLNNLRGNLELHGLSDVENMEEASNAKLCRKSNIQSLLLDWSNNEQVKEDIEYNDGDVMEGLKPHRNLKDLMMVYFKGKKFASWITMMTDLVNITLRDCHSCEGFPSLGHLPNLREIKIFRMNNVKVMGRNSYEGLGSGNIKLTDSAATKTVTTMYPSLTTLILRGLPNLEEWVEPIMNTGSELQSSVLVFPKLEVLKIVGCFKLSRIPSSCFPSLKELVIEDGDNSIMILESICRKVSNLTNLRLKNIGGEGGGSSSSSSDIACIVEKILKNNSTSLTTLDLFECQGIICLTVGVALEALKVGGCHDLLIINSVAELDFEGVKAHPDSLVKLPDLKRFGIENCPNLVSLPTFHEWHSLQFLEIWRCRSLEIRCWKGRGPEWFKIQHIPNILWDGRRWQ